MSLISPATRLVDAENVGTAYPAVPHLLLPQASSVFDQRSKRLRQLAQGHELNQWLNFCAALCAIQAQLAKTTTFSLDVAQAKTHMSHALPAYSVAEWQGSEAAWTLWQDLLNAFAATATPEQAALVQQLQAREHSWWQQQAAALLVGDDAAVTSEAAPFLAAALQLEWTLIASQLPSEAAVLHQGESTLCPVCGSYPVASVVQIGDPTHGVRYLVCSLCNSQWHATRAKCTNCDSIKEVNLLGQHAKDAVQGECCDDCQSYIKLMSMLRDTQVEAVADDLASLALDAALDQAGYGRAARNLFLVGWQ